MQFSEAASTSGGGWLQLSMACRTTLPAASSFSEGRVVGLASAFCTPWTSSSFAALPRHPPSGRAAATPSLAVGSGSLLGTRRGRRWVSLVCRCIQWELRAGVLSGGKATF